MNSGHFGNSVGGSYQTYWQFTSKLVVTSLLTSTKMLRICNYSVT